MTAKEYLGRYKTLNLEINVKLERIQRERARAEKCTSVLTGMPRGGGTDWTETAAKLIVKERELDHYIDQLLLLKDEIQAVIDQVPDEKERRLLEMRYLEEKSWSDIAADLGVAESTVRGKMHERALEKTQYIVYGLDRERKMW